MSPHTTKYKLTYTYKLGGPYVIHGTIPGKVHGGTFNRILKEVDGGTPRSGIHRSQENWLTLTITIDQSSRWGKP